ncbi:MAG: glycosyltransferase [Bacteroidota bacterium]
MVEGLLLVLAILSSAGLLLLAWAAYAATFPTTNDFRPTVDIIIAARNEEKRIGACLDSIIRLTYEKHLLQVVVVDDRSTDETAAIVSRYAAAHPWIRLITALPESDHLRGKTNAVTQGIEATSGEILLFTDADCEVPEEWVDITVKHFADRATGLVAGFTSLRGNSPFAEVQALDWFVLFSVASAMIRIGLPVTAVGTNLSVRRVAYESVGGYRAIPFSVTEDYALFHAITHAGGYRAAMPRESGAMVVSHPCASWQELYRQKKRWFAGGKGMTPWMLLLFSIPYFLNLLLVVGLFIDPASILLPLGIKCGTDFILCASSLTRFNRWKLLRSFLPFEAYFFFYVLAYPPIVLFRDAVVWKERDFGIPAAEHTNAPSS